MNSFDDFLSKLKNAHKDDTVDVLRSASYQELDYFLSRYYHNGSLLMRNRLGFSVPKRDLVECILAEKLLLGQ